MKRWRMAQHDYWMAYDIAIQAGDIVLSEDSFESSEYPYVRGWPDTPRGVELRAEGSFLHFYPGVIEPLDDADSDSCDCSGRTLLAIGHQCAKTNRFGNRVSA